MDCIFTSSEKQDILNQIVSGTESQDSIRDYISSQISDNNQSIFSELETYINARYTQTINALNNISNAIQENQWNVAYGTLGFNTKAVYSQTLFFLNFLMLFLKQIDNLFKFDRSSSDTIYVELELSCPIDDYDIEFTLSEPVVGSQSGKAICSIISSSFVVNDVIPVGAKSFSIKCYFCIGSCSFSKSILELLLKNLFLSHSISIKQDADLKQSHSKSFVKFLNQNIKDNNDSFLSQLSLSSFISSVSGELPGPSPAEYALSLYNAKVNTWDWLTDLLDLFAGFINSLQEYNQTSKIDRILECNFDAKKFNRLLGDALNYARSNEDAVLVKRNDQTYLDLNPDGQVCLDWDGGLPASVVHRHYDFQSFFQFLGKNSDGSNDLNTSFYLSKELVKMLENGFLFNF